MKLPVRTLRAEDAKIMARTVEMRTAVSGRVECHGLIWKSDALLEWELRQREMRKDPKVEVRIDELDLHEVYVEIPDGDDGPFLARSHQPEFTRGLSLFELRRLKKAIQEKELVDRLGRLDDREATRLRQEFYAMLGHGHDPVAQKRLSELQNQMAQLRLQQPTVKSVVLSPPTFAPTKKPRGPVASQKPSNHIIESPVATSIPPVRTPGPEASPPPAPVPPTATNIELTQRVSANRLKPKFPSMQIHRSPL